MRSLLVFVLLVAATATIGVLFEPGPWYATLDKPAWTPPNWVFAPAWTTLYVVIAVAGWRVWTDNGGRIDVALRLWGLQVVLNALWSWLFFGLHQPGWALLDILLLLAAIVAFMVLARAHSPLPSWLFLPYALWVGFAATLNFAVWRMN